MKPLTEQLRQAAERTKQLAEQSGYLVAESRRIKSVSAGIRDDAAMLRATIYIAGIQQRSRLVALPANAIDGSKTADTIRAPMASPAASRHIKVLIAEDNDDTVLTLSAILEDEGYSVRRARDGRQAMLVLAEFDPDVIVADLKMPGLSGWELAREVRRVGEAERPLLIAISGHFKRDPDRTLTQISGFNHFLAKPFDPKNLLALIQPLKDGQAA